MRELDRALDALATTVKEQLSDALLAFEQMDVTSADRVVERDDIVDNHYSSLEERIFQAMASEANVQAARRWRAALRVVTNLERIGDAACRIAKHSIMMATEPPPGIDVSIKDLSSLAVSAIDEGVRAFVDGNLELAKIACERERELDELYVKKLEQVIPLLDGGGHGRYLVHVLQILKYLEKTADYVLNIGEAVFFSVTGTRLKYPQFKQLEALLSEADHPGPMVYRHFWDGISGAIVLEIDSSDGSRLLFKEGGRQKMDAEIERVIEWEELAPLHTPHLIGRAADRDRRAVLREFADGTLLQDVLLSASSEGPKFAAVEALAEALLDIWSSTLVMRPPKLDYAQQIRPRLRDVLRKHPELEELAKEELAKYGGIFGALDRLQRREAMLAPPFSVWVHGDLNANNVVYDAATKQVVFIDVHRSHYGGYIGDLGILLTSTVRQFPKKKVARTLDVVYDVLLVKAQTFAERNSDQAFEERLRLARARALITSARLTDDAERAEALFADGLRYVKKVNRKLAV